MQEFRAGGELVVRVTGGKLQDEEIKKIQGQFMEKTAMLGKPDRVLIIDAASKRARLEKSGDRGNERGGKTMEPGGPQG